MKRLKLLWHGLLNPKVYHNRNGIHPVIWFVIYGLPQALRYDYRRLFTKGLTFTLPFMWGLAWDDMSGYG